ncbi:Uu.00g143690.m01.CDS01 [Anthostomella pinea]|uniref:Uu.00g143690.m01.CDS01 n=1 Tax=Anthostomella pinea TaxID=933095 RepID=A0AAI8VRL8_9PEZI|nr:Uu.00g143690.m01.CDS01 [Anthostomella pinea]
MGIGTGIGIITGFYRDFYKCYNKGSGEGINKGSIIIIDVVVDNTSFNVMCSNSIFGGGFLTGPDAVAAPFLRKRLFQFDDCLFQQRALAGHYYTIANAVQRDAEAFLKAWAEENVPKAKHSEALEGYMQRHAIQHLRHRRFKAGCRKNHLHGVPSAAHLGATVAGTVSASFFAAVCVRLRHAEVEEAMIQIIQAADALRLINQQRLMIASLRKIQQKVAWCRGMDEVVFCELFCRLIEAIVEYNKRTQPPFDRDQHCALAKAGLPPSGLPQHIRREHAGHADGPYNEPTSSGRCAFRWLEDLDKWGKKKSERKEKRGSLVMTFKWLAKNCSVKKLGRRIDDWPGNAWENSADGADGGRDRRCFWANALWFFDNYKDNCTDSINNENKNTPAIAITIAITIATMNVHGPASSVPAAAAAPVSGSSVPSAADAAPGSGTGSTSGSASASSSSPGSATTNLAAVASSALALGSVTPVPTVAPPHAAHAVPVLDAPSSPSLAQAESSRSTPPAPTSPGTSPQESPTAKHTRKLPTLETACKSKAQRPLGDDEHVGGRGGSPIILGEDVADVQFGNEDHGVDSAEADDRVTSGQADADEPGAALPAVLGGPAAPVIALKRVSLNRADQLWNTPDGIRLDSESMEAGDCHEIHACALSRSSAVLLPSKSTRYTRLRLSPR